VYGGALLIVGYALAACGVLVRRRDIPAARLLIADGALWGLNVKAAGSPLKTITLRSREQPAFCAIIFALRTRVFEWERRRWNALQRPKESEFGPHRHLGE
jgi:hypothetical protein